MALLEVVVFQIPVDGGMVAFLDERECQMSTRDRFHSLSSMHAPSMGEMCPY